MKIIVTGGAGYIGSVASHRFSALGHDVVVVDNLVQGHLAALPGSVGLEQADITDKGKLREILRKHQPDAVLHFAALTIAPESVRDPAPYWRVNLGGTLALLDAMREARTPVIVMSSTAAVYGSPPVLPVSEQSPLAPINPYGASKLAAERAMASYASAYGMATATLRYFNVAGASGHIGEDHRPETHLIPSVLAAAAGLRDPLSINGTDFPTPDGTAVRDYVHVEDLIDAHDLALQRVLQTGASLPPMNLGTRDGASVREVVAAAERITGLQVPVEYAERRVGDPPSLIADSGLARQLLDWRPHRSTLDSMVGSAWEWMRQYPHGYASEWT